eukprot:4607894-Prymnesium_polylepis.1
MADDVARGGIGSLRAPCGEPAGGPEAARALSRRLVCAQTRAAESAVQMPSRALTRRVWSSDVGAGKL